LDVAEEFGPQLRRHRMHRRLTQEALAERAGVSARSVGEIERGRGRSPRPHTLERLAAVLELEGLDRSAFLDAGQALFWTNRAVKPGQPTAPAFPADPALLTVPAPPAAPARQLPVDPADFVGRDDEFAVLDELLDPDATRPPLAVISGPPGVGKTAFAVRAGHRYAARFPDGQLYVVLGGEGRAPADPAEALAQLLQMLGVDGAAVPAGADARAAAFRARLAGRRVLIVLDDAAGHRQVVPLLPAEGAAVVVTSRLPLTGLPGATTIDLPPLSSEAAIGLLSRVAGEQRVLAEPRAAAELVAACGNLPLAVRIAAARLAARPQWRISMFAERLADERRRLDELRHGDLAVRPTLQLTHRLLSPAAARAFALLGELSGLGVRTFPDWVVAVLLDVPATAPADALDELLDARLVEPSGPDQAQQARARFHDVTRLYARERREAEIPDDAWLSALRRVGQGWLALARQAQDRLHCERLHLDRRGALEVRPDPRAVEVAADNPVDWFEAEREALAALVVACAAAGFADLARDLAGCCAEFYELRGYYDEWHRTMSAALVACRAADDSHGVAAMLRGLGSCLVEQDEWAAAESALRESRQLAERLADPAAVAMARKELGFMLGLTGRLAGAEADLRAGAETLDQTGHEAARAIALTSLGFVLQQRGDTSAAVDNVTVALDIAQRAGDPFLVAYTSRRLAGLLLAAGRIHEAEAVAERSALLFQQLGDLAGAAQSFRTLGEALAQDPSHTAEAERAFATAAELFASRGHSWGLALTELSLGELAVRRGLGGASERLRKALRFWTDNAVPALRARTLAVLGTAAEQSGDPSARELLLEAYGLYREIGAPAADDLARRLGLIDAQT
jgi:transcriptional regulator with XRE-family HTH domain/tetratricopeptide (TPR) repeat protein